MALLNSVTSAISRGFEKACKACGWRQLKQLSLKVQCIATMLTCADQHHDLGSAAVVAAVPIALLRYAARVLLLLPVVAAVVAVAAAAAAVAAAALVAGSCDRSQWFSVDS
jgi:hypothetical protein